MEISSATGHLLQSIQGLPDRAQQPESTEQSQPAAASSETVPVEARVSGEQQATPESDSRPAQDRAINAPNASAETTDNERVGTRIDLRA